MIFFSILSRWQLYSSQSFKQIPSKGRQKKKKKEKEHEKAESNERDKAKDIRIIKRLTIHGGYISSRWRSLESA